MAEKTDASGIRGITIEQEEANMRSIVENRNDNRTDRSTREEFVAPEVNIFETREGYVLQAEMPGVSKDGLEITIKANELTITGRRKEPAEPAEPIFRERHLADFRRVFELDPVIDTTKISARMEQGILTLTLPKSELNPSSSVKERKVSICWGF